MTSVLPQANLSFAYSLGWWIAIWDLNLRRTKFGHLSISSRAAKSTFFVPFSKNAEGSHHRGWPNANRQWAPKTPISVHLLQTPQCPCIASSAAAIFVGRPRRAFHFARRFSLHFMHICGASPYQTVPPSPGERLSVLFLPHPQPPIAAQIILTRTNLEETLTTVEHWALTPFCDWLTGWMNFQNQMQTRVGIPFTQAPRESTIHSLGHPSNLANWRLHANGRLLGPIMQIHPSKAHLCRLTGICARQNPLKPLVLLTKPNP